VTFVEFLILTLAVFRLARLVIEDTITEPLRSLILSHWPGQDVEYEPGDQVRGGTFQLEGKLYAQEPTKTGDKVAKLLSCYWCAVPYIAAVTVFLYWRFPGPVFWLALVAAVSGGASIIGILMHEAVDE
jgi:hypothetical protein